MGFFKDRYIGEHVRLILEVIDNLNTYNKPGLHFFADFEKAFDSISHKPMLNFMVTNHLRAPCGIFFTKKSYDSTAPGRRQEESYYFLSIFRHRSVPGDV